MFTTMYVLISSSSPYAEAIHPSALGRVNRPQKVDINVLSVHSWERSTLGCEKRERSESSKRPSVDLPSGTT
jgi:hypothetical protein